MRHSGDGAIEGRDFGSPLRIVGIWLTGAMLSVAAIWGIGAVFCDSIVREVRSDRLNADIPRPDTTRRVRSEGWGNTRYGKYRVGPMRDISLVPGRKTRSLPQEKPWGC